MYLEEHWAPPNKLGYRPKTSAVTRTTFSRTFSKVLIFKKSPESLISNYPSLLTNLTQRSRNSKFSVGVAQSDITDGQLLFSFIQIISRFHLMYYTFPFPIQKNGITLIHQISKTIVIRFNVLVHIFICSLYQIQHFI